MKLYFGLGLIIITLMVGQLVQSSPPTTKALNSTALQVNINRAQVMEMARRQLRNFWMNYVLVPNDASIVGRCLGIAKKIKQLMPIFIFKLGAIVTILGFLTLFSMKSLGLLVLLLIINVSGAVAKVTAALTHKDQDQTKKPQNIHLHLHQTKHGYHLESSGSGWEERIGGTKPDRENALQRLDSYNLYDKLSSNPYLRSYKRNFR